MIRAFALAVLTACTLAAAAILVSSAQAAPVKEADRIGIDLRRTTLVVRDMEASLRFYRDALGLKVTYDNVIRTPRTAKDDASAERSLRLVFLRANDDYVGQIGLMQYTKPVRTPRPAKSGDLSPGDIVLVFNTKGLAEKFEKAKAMGVQVDEAPHPTTYPSYDGKGVINVMFSAFYDPDGHYVEVNEVLDGLPMTR
ncbi:VOC family protein [Phenylobacterium sp.]|jgi:catechol 2,3-dioxygenase-like lactoylglutathione lyase family enzyme|uniref:VOC family protein n=1 Tax=Phenylobacterium sp. TaxID=1871053 RepID=UPI0037CC8346